MHKTRHLNKPHYLNKQHYGITITLLAILSCSTAWANTDNGFTLEKGDLVVEDGTAKATAFIGNFIGAGSVPIGSFTAFLGTNVPENWKEANGESLSKATYPELYAQIGDRYGSDDSLSFNLPDLRGEFIRGWDNGRGVDTGRQLGSYQADELKSHAHYMANTGSYAHDLSTNESIYRARSVGQGHMVNSNFEYDLGGSSAEANTGKTSRTGGTETRPRNIAVMYIIRVK